MKTTRWLKILVFPLIAGLFLCLAPGCRRSSRDSDDDGGDDGGGNGGDAPPAASEFTRITPQGLQANMNQGTATHVRYGLSCAPITGATRYFFTTSRGHTESSERPQVNVTLDSGGAVQWEVFAQNANDENTRTARASFNAVNPPGALPGVDFSQVRPTNLRSTRVRENTYDLTCDPVPGAVRYLFTTSITVTTEEVRQPSWRLTALPGLSVTFTVQAINAEGTRSRMSRAMFATR